MATTSSRTPRSASSTSMNGSRTPHSASPGSSEPQLNGEKHERRGLGEGLEGDEYIARIRYDNVLPPPPCPPKLLRIPGEGVPDHYLSPGFTSRLARQQEPNIELDAFLGMPIDLLGIPGAMEGDMRSIEFSDNPPLLDPLDYPLLKPASSLGKTKQSASGASFLRRTEYISTDHARLRHDSGLVRKESFRPKSAASRTQPQPRPRDDDPARITEDIEQGFWLADDAKSDRRRTLPVDESDAWDHPKHPTNPGLSVVDSYPLLPDPDTTPETGGYIVTKFKHNPGPNSDYYDDRLNDGILRPLPMRGEYIKDLEAKRAAHQMDPSQPDPGQPRFDYEFFVAEDNEILDAYKLKSRANAARRDVLETGDEDGESEQEMYPFNRVRTYETYQQTGNGEDPYSDTVIMALHDDDQQSTLPKGAYYYPVSHRSYLRPRRLAASGPVGLTAAASTEDDQVDRLEVYVVPEKYQPNGEAEEVNDAMEH